MSAVSVCGNEPPCDWIGPVRDNLEQAYQDGRDHLASHGVVVVDTTLDIPE